MTSCICENKRVTKHFDKNNFKMNSNKISLCITVCWRGTWKLFRHGTDLTRVVCNFERWMSLLEPSMNYFFEFWHDFKLSSIRMQMLIRAVNYKTSSPAYCDVLCSYVEHFDKLHCLCLMLTPSPYTF